ncbi:DUF6191 domain-containing protein [Streptomyces sp. HNM0663]|uniref:DUF6191 domain-containing protein n=1 Tax=Streptomyces chengmaiensis TaxID=3040919 RepID=A0ABT6HVB6_9ACTN|nr:DUF6191 domain-containing protein [Streptomyces chengmaiensis]MDH2392661.1 DUF6191 domain-containing protein [Streptomyces chengmaiensis]
MFNLIEELFAPGRRHTDEERKRLELTKADVNDNDPSRGPIDLASGRVTIRVSPQDPPPDRPRDPTPDRPRDRPAESPQPPRP